MVNLMINAEDVTIFAKNIAHLKLIPIPKLVALAAVPVKYQFWLSLLVISLIVSVIVLASLGLTRTWKNIFKKSFEIRFITQSEYRIPHMMLERQLAINRILVRQILDDPQNLKEDAALREYLASSTELEKWWVNVITIKKAGN